MNRYKYFYVSNGTDTTRNEFTEEHYRKAGVAMTRFIGMPILEAHTIVNQMNRDGAGKQTYWL